MPTFGVFRLKPLKVKQLLAGLRRFRKKKGGSSKDGSTNCLDPSVSSLQDPSLHGAVVASPCSDFIGSGGAQRSAAMARAARAARDRPPFESKPEPLSSHGNLQSTFGLSFGGGGLMEVDRGFPRGKSSNMFNPALSASIVGGMERDL